MTHSRVMTVRGVWGHAPLPQEARVFGSRSTKSAVAQLPEMEGIPARELALLDSMSTPVDIPAGRVVMQVGAPGSEALLVLRGELLVERDGEPVAVIGPGSVVGELALLSNEPRNATVTAASDVVALTMTRREFATMLERCPALARRILVGAVKRAGSTVS